MCQTENTEQDVMNIEWEPIQGAQRYWINIRSLVMITLILLEWNTTYKEDHWTNEL